MKRMVAGMLVAGAMSLAGVAFTAPAWGAQDMACGLGANNPTGSVQGTGSRTDCSGTVTLTVRVAKDVSGWWDPVVGEASRTGFGNGSLTAYGHCNEGNGSYYTWTISSSGNEIESGRVNRC